MIISEKISREQMVELATVPIVATPPPAIIGPNGESWTLDQLSAWFGAELDILEPAPHDGAAYVVEVAELRCVSGPCTQIVRVENENGDPVSSVAVARWWQDAPLLPNLPPDCHATYVFANAVIGLTNDGGDVGFGMGGGDMPGSSAVWVIHCDAPSGGVIGLGWKPFTNHDAIAVTFRIVPAYTPPEPPTGTCPVNEIRAELDKVTGTVETLRGMLPAVRTGLGSIADSATAIRDLLEG